VIAYGHPCLRSIPTRSIETWKRKKKRRRGETAAIEIQYELA
jgi:hypothetical protein